jgi:hypothetical protein
MMIEVYKKGNMFAAMINGKEVKRTKREHIDYVIRKAGVQEQSEPVESRFTINERFLFVECMVHMLAKGDQPSVVITGPGGLGKSFTVTKTLNEAGFKDISLLDEFEVGAKLGDKKFTVIKGYSTPKGLYRTLYENKDGVIVFDDCDSVLKDPVSLNLLKGALDSYSKRIISWRADMKDDELPQSFEFKGRVIFISNLSSSSLDQAIISRSMAVDLSMTTAQKVDRMRHLLDSNEFMPEFSVESKTDALGLIDTLKDKVKDLSLRTLIQVTKIRNSGGKNWKNLAEYVMVG